MEKNFLVSGFILLIAALPAFADSIVRVQCEEDDFGTEIYINGKFVGECPVDAPVKAGTVQLRARKIVEDDHEKLFEKKLRVVDGAAQRVEVILTAPQLTAEGKHKKEVAEASAQLRDAERGDIVAMEKIAEYLDRGMGVEKNPSEAKVWRSKAEAAIAQEQLRAANAGDINAMENMAARYDAGQGVSKDPSQAQVWRETAEAAKRETLAQEQAVKRKKLAQEQARINQKRIDQISFFEGTEFALNPKNDNPVASTLGLLLCPAMLAGDLISAPFKTTQINNIKSEAALRPSTWGKPDSMIARAYLQHKADSSTVESSLVVVAAK